MTPWWGGSNATAAGNPTAARAPPSNAPTTKGSISTDIIVAQVQDEKVLDKDKKIKALEEENRLLREALAKANHTTRPLSSSTRQSQRIIQQLSAELKAAKAYLIQPDEYAAADILSMLGQLNSQIENTASSINDLYESSEKVQHWDVHESVEFYQKQRDLVKTYLGERIYNTNTQIDEAIYDHDPITPENPLPLQVALQNVLVKWSIQVTDRFGPAGQGTAFALSAMYDSIRNQEEQAVAARWRVMTLSALDTRGKSYTEVLIPVFLALLLICGIRRDDATAKVVPLLRKKVASLENDLIKLKRAMDFSVLSSDLELCEVEPGERYTPSAMKDVYEDGKSVTSTSDTVLCCVGLGLRGVSIENVGPARRVSSKLIRRPDVALMSILI